MARAPWTREQLIEVLKLYCRTPFGRLHSRNPDIVALAKIIDRTPGAVAMKATNFASLDPTISQSGMGNVSALDRVVWEDFFAHMDRYVQDSDLRVSENGFEEIGQASYGADFPIGEDIPTLSKSRKNQGFFRDMILASYDSRCALTDVSNAELLVASHIVPWASDEKLRTNPQNGICLNALHDRAFDRGLISLSDDFSVLYSPLLSGESGTRFREFTNEKLKPPKRFKPDTQFLNYHRTHIFRP